MMEVFYTILKVCLPCLPDISVPHVTINDNKYKIIRLLGEGGFSYVYLVSKKSDYNSRYALKKIRCPYGSNDESFKNALKETRNYHRFSNSKTPFIVQSIEEAVVDEKDGSKIVYILLPFFEKSLQDIINYNVLNGGRMEEPEVLRLFVGICRGLQAMHKFKTTGRSNITNGTGEENEEDQLLVEDSEDELNDSPEPADATELQELCPYAHRDIKPANVMISAEGLPVLVDLGSCSRARVNIHTRQQALSLTDFASEHCTLPYRAPELLDVDTKAKITEKTDIWSLGCLLYCCCFGFSPFEKLEIDQGANLSVAISQGNYIIPNDRNDYSEGLEDLIRRCLQLKSEDRPSIDELLDSALELTRSQ